MCLWSEVPMYINYLNLQIGLILSTYMLLLKSSGFEDIVPNAVHGLLTLTGGFAAWEPCRVWRKGLWDDGSSLGKQTENWWEANQLKSKQYFFGGREGCNWVMIAEEHIYLQNLSGIQTWCHQKITRSVKELMKFEPMRISAFGIVLSCLFENNLTKVYPQLY